MRWTDVEEIAEALEEEYPDEDAASLSLEEIKEMAVSLEGFEAYDVEVGEHLLEEIREAWVFLRQ